METVENKVRELMETFQRYYFVEMDKEAVLSLMDENIYWTGIRRQYTGRGRKTLEVILEEERKNRQSSFDVESSQYKTGQLADGLYIVWGQITIREKSMGKVYTCKLFRLSAVLKDSGAGLHFLIFHLSMPEKCLSDDTVELIQKYKDLKDLLQNLPGGVMCCDYTADLNLIEYSDGFLDMFGYAREEIQSLFDNKFSNMIYEQDIAPARKSVAEQMAAGDSKVIEYRVRCRDGRLVTVLDHGKLVKRGGVDVFYCVLSDITESKKADNELRLSLERHKIIMEQTTDIIFEWDVSSGAIMLPEKWEKKFGYKPHQLRSAKNRAGLSYVYPDDAGKVLKFAEDIIGADGPLEAEVRLLKSEGTFIWCKIRATLQINEQENERKVIGVIIDIDKEKKQTQRLMERAERDTLTRLYNKGAAEQFAQDYLNQMAEDEKCAVYIVDIDNFKFINDVYGHLSGDVFLTEIAQLLRNSFRKDDIIGRIGGDEFIIVMKDIPGDRMAVEKAKDVLADIGQLMKHEIHQVSCSIGISYAPRDGKDFLVLYRKADTALYYVKGRGKNGYKVFTPEMDNPKEQESLQLYDRRNAAIDSDEYFKPNKSRMAEYVFHVLYNAADIRSAIGKVLEIIGKQFDVSRVYIFEDSEDGKTRSNTFEWCNQGIKPYIKERQNIQYDGMERYYECFDSYGIYYCRNIEEMPEPERGWAKEVDAKSVWQCVIRENGKNRGYIGFNECKDARCPTQEQLNTLDITAKIISMFLLKLGTGYF